MSLVAGRLDTVTRGLSMADARRPSLHPTSSPAGLSDWLDDDGGGHAAAGAHCDQPHLLVPAFELVEDGADEDGTGGTDGVAEGHRSAVDVDLVAVDVQVARELLGDDG